MGRTAAAWRACRWVTLAIAAAGASATASAETLEGAVATALQTNPRMARASAQADAAGHDVREARGGFFPSLDINGGIGAEESDIEQLERTDTAAGTLTRREFGATLRQMIYDGFATSSEVDRRTALLDAAQYNTRDTSESVAFEAVQVYLEVLRGRELVVLAEENVRKHQRVLDDVELKFRRGVGQRADVDQARGRLALARSTLTQREGRLAEALSSYERVVGALPGELAKPARSPSGLLRGGDPDPALVESAIGGALAVAEDRHPALLRARAEREASESAVKVARAAYHPRVDLEANVSRNENLSGVEGLRDSETIMLVGRWNVFRGGSDRAAEQAAVARKLAAEENIADIRRVIAENVAIALKARATTDARIGHLQAHVAASERTVEAYMQQFDLGRRTLLDTLNAENELFNARSNLVGGLYDDLLNQFFVEAAKGQLVSSLGLTPPPAP